MLRISVASPGTELPILVSRRGATVASCSESRDRRVGSYFIVEPFDFKFELTPSFCPHLLLTRLSHLTLRPTVHTAVFQRVARC